MKKIFIFGCARSGTTLLLNLFRCFQKTRVVDREHKIEEFVNFFDGKENVVLKRTPSCGGDLKPKILRNSDVWLVDIHRDPRSVVTSIHPGIDDYYTDFSRWERDIRVIQEISQIYSQFISIKYENLILNADRIQELMSSKLGLKKVCRFNDFTKVVRKENISPLSIRALGGIRPLEKRNINRWKNNNKAIKRVLDQIDEYPQMLDYLIKYGYESDKDWIKKYLAF